MALIAMTNVYLPDKWNERKTDNTPQQDPLQNDNIFFKKFILSQNKNIKASN